MFRRLACLLGGHVYLKPWEQGYPQPTRVAPLHNGYARKDTRCPRCGAWVEDEILAPDTPSRIPAKPLRRVG